MGFEKCSLLKENNMGVVERKKVIKLLVDLVMVFIRNVIIFWSCVLIVKVFIDNKIGFLVKWILDLS